MLLPHITASLVLSRLGGKGSPFAKGKIPKGPGSMPGLLVLGEVVHAVQVRERCRHSSRRALADKRQRLWHVTFGCGVFPLDARGGGMPSPIHATI